MHASLDAAEVASPRRADRPPVARRRRRLPSARRWSGTTTSIYGASRRWCPPVVLQRAGARRPALSSHWRLPVAFPAAPVGGVIFGPSRPLGRKRMLIILGADGRQHFSGGVLPGEGPQIGLWRRSC